jgi:hypothetical protein
MKQIFSFLTVCLLSWLTISNAFAAEPYGTFSLPAAGVAEGDEQSRKDLSPTLSTSDVWAIHAETRYYGQAAHATWGSRLLHAETVHTDLNPNDYSGNEPQSRLCFYMRPQIGSPGATTSNTGRLLVRNAAFTDVLNIDTSNGTLFTFDISSDGSGAIFVKVTIENNGEYTREYASGEITEITALVAGSHYDVEGNIREGAGDAYLMNPGDIKFLDVKKDKTFTQKVMISGVSLTAPINLSVTGEGFSASATQVPATGGEVEFTFAPTAVKAYTGTLTLTSGTIDPVTVNLTGNSDFTLPVTISDETTEHWYYIQFARRAGDNKVLQAAYELQDTIRQKVLVPGEDTQLWKIGGDWDEYYLVNKATGKNYEFLYDIDKDKYVTGATDQGNLFRFVRYNTTETWQLFNQDLGFVDTTQVERPQSATKRYLNDYQGVNACAYNLNDAGNQLTFIPAAISSLNVGVDSIGFGKTALNEPVVKNQTVVGLNLTGDITLSKSGADAAAFTVAPASLPSTGGALTITFTPTEARDYAAVLTVSNAGISKTVKLTGSGVMLPVKISDENTEHWYFIQFKRRAGQDGAVIAQNGTGNNLIQMAKADEGALDYNLQLWKFVGTWDKYKIVAFEDEGAFKYDATTSRYQLSDVEDGDLHRLETNSAGEWGLYNMTMTSGNRYINDFGGNQGTEVGVYSFDGGSSVNLIPTGPTILADPSIVNIGEIEVGASFSKEVTISGFNLTSAITYALGSEADAAAFTIAEESAIPDGALDATGGTLVITFSPTQKKAYYATVTLASGTETLVLPLTGNANFDLPVRLSTADQEWWYYISFERLASYNYVLTEDAEGDVKETVKSTDDSDLNQYWKFTGEPATGYKIIGKSGKAFAFSDDLNIYTIADEEVADDHQFIRSSAGKWQLYNLTIQGVDDEGTVGRYINDYQGLGANAEYASLYAANDGGNALTFTPIGFSTGLVTVDGANDAIVATHYYNLQGVKVKQLVKGGIYIKQDIYESKKVRATKILVPKK